MSIMEEEICRKRFSLSRSSFSICLRSVISLITSVRLSAVRELVGLFFSTLSNQYSLVAI